MHAPVGDAFDHVMQRPNRLCSAATCRNTMSAPITCAPRSKTRPHGPVATPFPIQESSMMASLAKADCLMIREPFEPAAKARQPVRYHQSR
ncbi:MAG: hypothetical protein ABSA68_18115 [Xanthobacteraceae bacterium]